MPTRRTPLARAAARSGPVPQPELEHRSAGRRGQPLPERDVAPLDRLRVLPVVERRVVVPAFPALTGHRVAISRLPTRSDETATAWLHSSYTSVPNRNSSPAPGAIFLVVLDRIGRVRSMFISQAESTGFSEPDSERAPAELARRRRWPAMISRNTLARAAAIGLIVMSAGVRPTAQTQRDPAIRLQAAVSNAGSVVGSAWNADNSGIPGARLRLRNVSTGKIAASVIADQLGQFRFDAAPGSYLIELVDESAKAARRRPGVHDQPGRNRGDVRAPRHEASLVRWVLQQRGRSGDHRRGERGRDRPGACCASRFAEAVRDGSTSTADVRNPGTARSRDSRLQPSRCPRRRRSPFTCSTASTPSSSIVVSRATAFVLVVTVMMIQTYSTVPMFQAEVAGAHSGRADDAGRRT